LAWAKTELFRDPDRLSTDDEIDCFAAFARLWPMAKVFLFEMNSLQTLFAAWSLATKAFSDVFKACNIGIYRRA
jgi:hypothetical protein